MKKYVLLFLRIAVAFIFTQSMFFKFSAAPESIAMFSDIGLEPFGRIIVGILELFAVIFILLPKTIWLGAILTMGILGGAIVTHLTILGIDVNDDGGTLFILAISTFLIGLIVLWNYKKTIPFIGSNQ